MHVGVVADYTVIVMVKSLVLTLRDDLIIMASSPGYGMYN